ncbi:RHS repeat-associated core domain-containing protein [Pseudomonas sp. NPDC089395]|uniref:RHS repeat-associated core domain-containing protein n=1 Tax=Pseudomonas sp. NPDC089395 TaxID=3364460 RepID=UPI00381856C2
MKTLGAMATEVVPKFFYRSGVITTIVGFKRGISLMRKNYSILGALGEGEHSRIFACDKLGSVMLDMCRESNTPQRFTPYGFSTRIPLSPVSFKGNYFDPISQGYLLGTGYRMYSPILMRFKSPDSLSPFGVGGLNQYAFV